MNEKKENQSKRQVIAEIPTCTEKDPLSEELVTPRSERSDRPLVTPKRLCIDFQRITRSTRPALDLGVSTDDDSQVIEEANPLSVLTSTARSPIQESGSGHTSYPPTVSIWLEQLPSPKPQSPRNDTPFDPSMIQTPQSDAYFDLPLPQSPQTCDTLNSTMPQSPNSDSYSGTPSPHSPTSDMTCKSPQFRNRSVRSGGKSQLPAKKKSPWKHLLRKIKYRANKEIQLKDQRIQELKLLNEKYKKQLKRLRQDPKTKKSHETRDENTVSSAEKGLQISS